MRAGFKAFFLPLAIGLLLCAATGWFAVHMLTHPPQPSPVAPNLNLPAVPAVPTPHAPKSHKPAEPPLSAQQARQRAAQQLPLVDLGQPGGVATAAGKTPEVVTPVIASDPSAMDIAMHPSLKYGHLGDPSRVTLSAVPGLGANSLAAQLGLGPRNPIITQSATADQTQALIDRNLYMEECRKFVMSKANKGVGSLCLRFANETLNFRYTAASAGASRAMKGGKGSRQNA